VTYPGIFEAPERLTLIGRPRDPLFGQSPIKKYAVLALLLSLIFGGLLAVLAEYFDPRVRSRRQVRAATGLPVVARVSVQEA
jgi:capsular polysaccharide biosynthesis protein